MKIAVVIPHIFMQQEILPKVIFSPGELAISLSDELTRQGHTVTLFTPGPITTKAKNITADLSLFERELIVRGDSYLDLLKKHPLTFITLARQVQSELIADVIARANNDEFDIVHMYGNEEEIALPFAQFCTKPVVFTHHDPFNFLVKYRSIFPRYAQLPWISISDAQRKGMPKNTNWVATIYHGIDKHKFSFNPAPRGNYIAFLGRIIEPKGVHLAIAAVQQYNKTAVTPLTLRIAGKHYSGKSDSYWQTHIEPHLADPNIIFEGHKAAINEIQTFLGNARALLVPSLFEEPFGMVSIEALACGTPVIGLDSGALPEVIGSGKTGYVIQKASDERTTVDHITKVLRDISVIDRNNCRQEFETRFTLNRMASEHEAAYQKLIDATK